MDKLYKSIFLFLGVLGCVTAYAQKPSVKISGPQTYQVGTPITPLQLTNSGGAVPNLLYSQVSTIAGSGLYGYKDGAVKDAQFERPIGITRDKSGNIFVADANAHVIRKITPAGVVSTFAGSGKAGFKNGQDTSASFNVPTDVVADNVGNIYVSDFVNNMIRKITPTGLVSTYAGHLNDGTNDGDSTYASFSLPNGLAIDKNNFIYVADTYNHKIRKIDPNRHVVTIAGSGRPALADGHGIAASFNTPYNLALDDAGNIYVADRGNKLIRKISPNFDVTSFPKANLVEPVGIAVDKLNRVYVTCDSVYSIQQFDNVGNPTGSIAFSGSALFKGNLNSTDTLSRFRGTMGLFLDTANNLLIADPGSDLIRKVAVTGYAVSGRLPAGLTLNPDGSISGTPTQISPATSYTLKAYNTQGIDSAAVVLTVGIGTQVITYNPLPVKMYGDTDFMANAVSTNVNIPVSYTSSNPAVATIVNSRIHIVAAGASIITANQPGNVNFTAATSVAQTLTVNQAILTVTADNKIKTVGTDNPALTYQLSGFVNGDDTTKLKTKPVVTTTAVKTSVAGTYPITPSGAVADNYSFNFISGNLIVFPIPIITANGPTTILASQSVVLSATPATGYAYQWQLNGVNIPGATLSSYTATVSGSYTVSINANNYTTYSANVPVTSEFVLPDDNFTVLLTASSCKGSNNGVINVSAKQSMKYNALITGNGVNVILPFTDTVSVHNLVAGNYGVCITVDGQNFERCFSVIVSEPKDLALYTAIDPAKNTLSLQLNGGDLYHVVLNGESYTTSDSQLTLQLKTGNNKLSVSTDKACQGVINRNILSANSVASYPNPFQGILNVNVGSLVVPEVQLNVLNIQNGKLLYSKTFANQSGVVQLDLSGLASGVYYLSVKMNDTESGFKVIKQ